MQLSDFEFCGYLTLSRFFRIETEDQARTLSEFMGSPDALVSFEIAGPGTYYLLVDSGWDRGGDYTSLIIKRVPDTVQTPDEFLAQLKDLKEAAERASEPFTIARGISTREEYERLTDEEKGALARIDSDAYEDARHALDEYLQGY